MLLRRMLIASAAMILSNVPASAGPVVYAVSTNYNTFTGEFGTVDLTTGAFNQIGPATTDPLA